MGVSAASFIYIAVADLFPHLHARHALRDAAQQLVLMLAGIGTMVLVQVLR